jgi:hypothetical protein
VSESPADLGSSPRRGQLDTGTSDELNRQARQLHRDTRNHSTALHHEIVWKDTRLRQKHYYMQDLIHGGEGARKICGQYIVDYCKDFREQTGRNPRVLDFACGPVSPLAYLAHEELADLTAVDILATQYIELFAKHRLEAPVQPRHGVGEYLTDQLVL